MRIPCPFCGDRDQSEFAYRRSADLRPAPDASAEAFTAYVYSGADKFGPLEEHWYHAHGCRRWLVVTRDTRTHEIFGARLAGEAPR